MNDPQMVVGSVTFNSGTAQTPALEKLMALSKASVIVAERQLEEEIYAEEETLP
jgi:hypothetical protein